MEDSDGVKAKVYYNKKIIKLNILKLVSTLNNKVTAKSYSKYAKN